MSPDPSDRELMQRLGSDAAAFEALYRRHVRRLTMYAASRSRRPEDVADLVATTFVAALDSASQYDPARGEVLPWLMGIARHLASDSARYAQREREALAKVAGWRSLGVDEIAELEERIDAAHEAAELEQSMVRLHVRDREPLVLVGRVGLNHAQAAQALGISGPSFRIRLMRARRALRKARAQLDAEQHRPANPGHVTT